MNIIKKFFEEQVRKYKEHKMEQLVKRSQYLFQLCENNGDIWLTYGGCLVCPMNLFISDATTTISDIRKLYIEDNKD